MKSGRRSAKTTACYPLAESQNSRGAYGPAGLAIGQGYPPGGGQMLEVP